jgi:hypothetical protein
MSWVWVVIIEAIVLGRAWDYRGSKLRWRGIKCDKDLLVSIADND